MPVDETASSATINSALRIETSYTAQVLGGHRFEVATMVPMLTASGCRNARARVGSSGRGEPGEARLAIGRSFPQIGSRTLRSGGGASAQSARRAHQLCVRPDSAYHNIDSVTAEETPRHFSIVLDHSRHHLGRRIGRRVGSLAGALLVVLGLTASIPAIPATVAVAGLAVAWASGEPKRAPGDDIPVREVILVWAVATPVAIGGLRIGLRLVRRNRTLILFLRRFRY